MLYTALLSLLWPVWVLVLAQKAWRQPAYRPAWHERVWPSARLGRGWNGPVLWVHAVSVGETRAALPLVRAWLDTQPPHAAVFLSQTTPTGRQTACDIFKDLIAKDRLRMAYLPIDHPWLMRRMIRSVGADLLLLMETEIWPGLLAAAKAQNLPVALANGRLSERSLRGYQAVGSIAHRAFASLGLVMAQTEADAQRFDAAGVASRAVVTGSVKFDHEPNGAQVGQGRAWRQALAVARVWCVASSREGEETLVLAAWARSRPANTLLMVVPRHPHRAAAVARLADGLGLSVRLKSAWTPEQGGPMPDVWLGDTLGEMSAYLAAADLVLVGGGLLRHGGQSPIEAAALGKPLAMGPHMENFRVVAHALQDHRAAVLCATAEDFIDWATKAQSDAGEVSAEAQAMGAAAAAFVQEHRGATQRCIRALLAWRPEPGPKGCAKTPGH